jgi:hypothetical protein
MYPTADLEAPRSARTNFRDARVISAAPQRRKRMGSKKNKGGLPSGLQNGQDERLGHTGDILCVAEEEKESGDEPPSG